MTTYVMGDLHGNFQGLCQCLEKCRFDYENDTLVQLGDIVDGGDEIYECIEELLKIYNLIPIRGNHDAWLLEFIKTGYHPVLWNHGGLSTVRSYLHHANKRPIIVPAGGGFKVSLNSDDIPITHQRFFDRQLLYYIDNSNNCFVHGGFDRFQPFYGQRPESYYWDRQLWSDALRWQINRRYYGYNSDFETTPLFNEIYIGHNSTLHYGVKLPLNAANIYNVDTGSGKNGRLTIMNVNTKQYWQT